MADESLNVSEIVAFGMTRRREIAAEADEGLRILAEIEGPDRVEHAREAVTRLTGTSARLELAKAQLALADALARGGAVNEARSQWASAAKLAQICGAAGLARFAAEAANSSQVAPTPRTRRD